MKCRVGPDYCPAIFLLAKFYQKEKTETKNRKMKCFHHHQKLRKICKIYHISIFGSNR
jgi:hypothetical protein